MEDATTRELEHVREVASTAAFRIIAAFCGLGAVDLIAALGRFLVTVALPAPVVASLTPGAAVATGWGLGCLALVFLTFSLKLAAVVSIHRRRVVDVQPLGIWVATGLFGVGAHVCAMFVGTLQTLWMSRALGVETVATWSLAASASGVVDGLLDVVFGVVVLVIAARAVQRDRRQPGGQATYRSPGPLRL